MATPFSIVVLIVAAIVIGALLSGESGNIGPLITPAHALFRFAEKKGILKEPVIPNEGEARGGICLSPVASQQQIPPPAARAFGMTEDLIRQRRLSAPLSSAEEMARPGAGQIERENGAPLLSRSSAACIIGFGLLFCTSRK